MMGVGSALLAALGVALVAWTGRVLGWRRFCGITDAPASPALPLLVMGGPYRYVRHPGFAGLALLALGGAAWSGSLAAWLLCALISAALVLVARREERLLSARFGEAYRRYLRVTPLLPRLRERQS